MTEDEKTEEPARVSAEPRADLSVRVVADRAEFEPGEDIGLTVSVTNKGDAVAPNVRFGHRINQAWLVQGADELSSRPSIAAGQQKVLRVVLRPMIPSSSSVLFQFLATVDGVADPTPGDNGTDLSVPVRLLEGSVSGVVYLDRNGNGAFDEGEGLPNAVVSTRGGKPYGLESGFADANGAFRMCCVAAGSHKIWSINGGHEYVVQPGFADFVVENQKETRIVVPVVPPVRTVLSASLAFDRPSYAPTDPVGIDITLRNGGNAPISGVVAVCQSYSAENLTSANWGVLAPNGAGVTVPAGGELKVRVTDSVPKGMRYTTFYASCSFGNAGENDQGYAYAGSAYARVHGVFGRILGKVVDSANGQPVRNAPVGVLDPVTRRPLKDVRTNSNGEFTVLDVPVGKVVLVVAGRWAPADGAEFVVDVLPDTEVSPELRVVPSDVEVPEFARHVPDFTVTAKFDKSSYDINEPMRAHVTVKNVGTGYEAEVGLLLDWASGDAELDFDKSQLGEFSERKTVRMWPGESRELTLVGHAPWFIQDKVTLRLKTSSSNDTNPSNDGAFTSAAVTFLNGDAAVVLYGDRNANGTRDPGEELRDTKVTVSGGSHNVNVWREAITDGSGRARFQGLPVGVMRVWADYRDGWVRHETAEMTITADAESVLEIGAVRPLSDKLSASLRFAKREYAAGEDYVADITITNNTGTDLPLVKAFCSGAGEPGEIHNSGLGWGPLAWDGGGVSVPNGQTRAFRVSGEQPQDARRIGYATIGCSFGPDPYEQGAPVARDAFRVPGQRADAFGTLVRETGPGTTEPVPGMVLVLVDHLTQRVVTRTITGADGTFQVFNLPVGRYDVVVPGPWKVEYRRMNPFFHVRVGESWNQVLYLEPGPETEDPGYPLPENEIPGVTVPPAQAGSGGADGGAAEALAKTGVSVLGLGVLGALLVGFGLAASVIGRRSRTA